MAISREYQDHVLDLLAPAGPVSARRMFGGAGLYLDGTMFALIAGDELYFKVDDANRPDFEAAGSEPFTPFADKPYAMSYWRVPEEVMEDTDDLAAWAKRAWEAARWGKSGSRQQ